MHCWIISFVVNRTKHVLLGWLATLCIGTLQFLRLGRPGIYRCTATATAAR